MKHVTHQPPFTPSAITRQACARVSEIYNAHWLPGCHASAGLLLDINTAHLALISGEVVIVRKVGDRLETETI